MTAGEMVRLLGGKWDGDRALVRCPVEGHGQGRGDLCPSLSIAEGECGRVLVKCFAGCPAEEVFAAARRLPGSTTRANLSDFSPKASAADTSAAAYAMWRASQKVEGTPAEIYLRGRGLTPGSSALRFLSVRHPKAACALPTLLCAISDSRGQMRAIQRTFLRADGAKAHVSPGRMMLGRLGRGAVQLAPAAEVMGLAEGVETAMSASSLFGIPVWAACGTRMAKVELPAAVRAVTIFADHDAPGEEAAIVAARRLQRLGLTVDIRRPISPGDDWNDVLLAQGRNRETVA